MPIHRWVVFLSGLAHITLPHSNAEARVNGGKNGAILALDTAAVSTEGIIRGIHRMKRRLLCRCRLVKRKCLDIGFYMKVLVKGVRLRCS